MMRQIIAVEGPDLAVEPRGTENSVQAYLGFASASTPCRLGTRKTWCIRHSQFHELGSGDDVMKKAPGELMD